jgi:predicted dienelactone hydrolase
MKLALKILGVLAGLLIVAFVAAGTYIYATALKPTKPVGFQQIRFPNPGHAPLSAAIWYPTSAKPGFALLGLTGERVARDGAVLGDHLPLIIVSHGTGGTPFGHADTALALASSGFVVVAPMHSGDNFQNDSDVGKTGWLPNREGDLRRTLDMVTTTWKDRAHLDPRRIGFFGFSAGATTGLVTIGGEPDLQKIWSQCSSKPEFVCKLISAQAYRHPPATSWSGDSRIGAAVLVAPGLGFTFAPNGLSKVRVPVQLWDGTEDRTVPWATNTGLVAKLLPEKPEVHLVSGASHYSFLAPCGLIAPPQLCQDPNGFDRAAFHHAFNRSIVRFFEVHLSGPLGPAKP